MSQADHQLSSQREALPLLDGLSFPKNIKVKNHNKFAVQKKQDEIF